MKIGKLKPHEIEWNSLTPFSGVSTADTLTYVNQKKWVYDWKKHHKLYGSGLVAAPNYCFQNIGGTTHKT